MVSSSTSASVAVLSGAGLRSRKVDNKRAMAVIREADIPDLGDTEALNRVVSTVSTGVEKDEEEVYLIWPFFGNIFGNLY